MTENKTLVWLTLADPLLSSPYLAELHPSRHQELLEHDAVLTALSSGNANSTGSEALPVMGIVSPLPSHLSIVTD